MYIYTLYSYISYTCNIVIRVHYVKTLHSYMGNIVHAVTKSATY